MAQDTHPADEIVKAVQGLWNGDNFKQTIRDAWDRMHGAASPTMDRNTPDDTPFGKKVQAANQSFLDASKAADIRSKANKVLGK